MSWFGDLTEAAREGAADLLGVGGEVASLREARQDAQMLARRVEDLRFGDLSGSGGADHELERGAHREMVRRGYLYYFGDPVVRRTVDLHTFYVFGTGVARPTYRAEDQNEREADRANDVLDRIWCHDEATQTLTEDGWLSLSELKECWVSGRALRVASFDGAANAMRFDEPLDFCCERYAGEMLKFGTAHGMRLMVTPNHRMVVHARPFSDEAKGGLDDNPWVTRRADEMRSVERAPVCAPLRRPLVDTFVLPAVHTRRSARRIQAGERRRTRVYAALAGGASVATVAEREGVTPLYVAQIHSGRAARLSVAQHAAKKQHEPLSLPMDAWLTWLGWYISEGEHTDGSVCQQHDNPRLGAIRRACRDLGVDGTEWTRDGRLWTWYPRPPAQFKAWLREHVGTIDCTKRIPAFVFELDGSQQMRLLRGLMGGDGSPTDWEDKGCGNFFTCSRQLADDTQRVALSAGWYATVGQSRRAKPGKPIQPEFVVTISRRTRRWVPKSTAVQYDGEVYCFTMPTGTMVTRREGKPAISGNSDGKNQASLTGVQGQFMKSLELQVAGNVFLLLFRASTDGGEDSPLQIRSLAEREVVEVITHPDDDSVPLYYLREYTPRVWDSGSHTYVPGDLRRAYYRDWDNEPPPDGEVFSGRTWTNPPEEMIAEGVVYHVKVNCTSDMRFGISELHTSLRFAKSLSDYMTARMSTVQAIAQLAMQMKVNGGPRSVAQAQTKLADVQRLAARVDAGGAEGNQRQRADEEPRARALVSNQGAELRPMVADTGAAGAATDISTMKGMMAAGSGIPVTHLGDVPGAVTSAVAMDGPLLRLVRARQELWREVIRDILGYALEGVGLDGDRIEVTMPATTDRDASMVATTLTAVIAMFAQLESSPQALSLARFVLSEVLDAMGKQNARAIAEELLPDDTDLGAVSQGAQGAQDALQAAQDGAGVAGRKGGLRQAADRGDAGDETARRDDRAQDRVERATEAGGDIDALLREAADRALASFDAGTS